MTLDGEIRAVEAAAAELKRAGAGASGWADGQRQEFDTQRMTPLTEAAPPLIAALRRAQDACARAERLLARG